MIMNNNSPVKIYNNVIYDNGGSSYANFYASDDCNNWEMRNNILYSEESITYRDRNEKQYSDSDYNCFYRARGTMISTAYSGLNEYTLVEFSKYQSMSGKTG